MVAGFVAYNDNGNVQIDEHYINLHLIATGQLSFSAAEHGGYTSSLAGLPSGVVVATSGSGYHVNEGQTVEGGSWTFHFFSLTNSSPVRYYVFGRTNNNVNVGNHLVVRDSNNSIVYHNNMLPLRVNQYGPRNYPTPDGDISFSIPAGRQVAIVNGGNEYSSEATLISNGNQSDVMFVRSFYRTDNNVAHLGVLFYTWRIYPGGIGEWTHTPIKTVNPILIDVTHY